MDTTILTQFAILVPVVIGLVQVLKMVLVPDRFAGLVSLVLGVAGTFLVGEADWRVLVLQGLIVGLVASGLWSTTRSTLNW